MGKSSSWIRHGLLIALIGINSAYAIAFENQAIRLVVTDSSAFAYETANRLQILLEQSMPGVVLERVDTMSMPASSLKTTTRLVVTVGDVAWKSVAATYPRDSPILAVMPQRYVYEIFIGRSPRNASAIFLEQPVGRMLNLVSLLKPNNAQVGIVLGAVTQEMTPALQTEASERRQHLHIEMATEEAAVGRVLAGVIRDSNVLLAIPDPVVQTTNTVQPILLMSYHAGIPVIGYSAAYLRAGAVLSLYSTPEQLARQAAEAVIAWLQGKGLPVVQVPKYFTVGINSTVARSLGIDLPDADTLESKLRSMKE